MNIIGSKNNKDLFNNLISRYIPKDIDSRVYIESMGGSFGLYKILSETHSFKKVIYNDITEYDTLDLPSGVEIYNLDYKEIFKLYNTKDSFFYIDPPYINKERYYEGTFRTESDHFRLFNEIKKLKGKWMLSYQENDLLRGWYSDYNFHKYRGDSMYHQSEIVITNY